MNMDSVVKPAIKLFYSEQLTGQEALEQILYGAEEEGVPVETLEAASDDAAQLAYDAAAASVLETGIGLSAAEAALQFRRIPPETPLDRVRVSDGEEALRRIGANAARLVKKMPLKGFSTEEGGGTVGQKSWSD